MSQPFASLKTWEQIYDASTQWKGLDNVCKTNREGCVAVALSPVMTELKIALISHAFAQLGPLYKLAFQFSSSTIPAISLFLPTPFHVLMYAIHSIIVRHPSICGITGINSGFNGAFFDTDMFSVIYTCEHKSFTVYAMCDKESRRQVTVQFVDDGRLIATLGFIVGRTLDPSAPLAIPENLQSQVFGVLDNIDKLYARKSQPKEDKTQKPATWASRLKSVPAPVQPTPPPVVPHFPIFNASVANARYLTDPPLYPQRHYYYQPAYQPEYYPYQGHSGILFGPGNPAFDNQLRPRFERYGGNPNNDRGGGGW